MCISTQLLSIGTYVTLPLVAVYFSRKWIEPPHRQLFIYFGLILISTFVPCSKVL